MSPGRENLVPVTDTEGFLAPDDEVDLENCAREPIHIPGSVQPRGALLAVTEDALEVVHASENIGEILGLEGIGAYDVIDRPLSHVLGATAADQVSRHLEHDGDLRDLNPLPLHVEPSSGSRAFDVLLHRPPSPGGLVVLEFDSTGTGSFARAYRDARRAITALDRAGSLQGLYETTTTEVRALTGFDRVMVYRFDEDDNGEVVAEAKREDLNSFLGLHYPATDIPPQARALYEKNWVRLISDIDYTPVPILASARMGSEPLDLTYSTMRSVSPIHVEYLQNMGVSASMSISLLEGTRLWGLIACHHYSGPHAPGFSLRAAAEFLGSVLSIRLVAQVEEDRIAAARTVGASLADLVARSREESTPLAFSLTESMSLADVVHADGAVVLAEGHVATVGTVPPEPGYRAIADWVLSTDDDIIATSALSRDAPEIATQAPEVAGVLAARLPGDQAVLWLRHEVERNVDWGGDPYNKAIARREGGQIRLSPRRSFEKWREVVRGQSRPWRSEELETAAVLRRHLVEGLYLVARRDARAAEMLQNSSLPAELPSVPGWQLEARYDPADGGAVGGDWYDALILPSRKLVIAVGDVTGHGIRAASTMGQLRNALRALLMKHTDLPEVATDLDAFARWALPDEIATALIVVVDPAHGRAEFVACGHMGPLLVHTQGISQWPQVSRTRPVGLGPAPVRADTVDIPPGSGLLLFTDGLIERRDQSLAAGLERLRQAVGDHGTDLDAVIAAARLNTTTDDSTALLLMRDSL